MLQSILTAILFTSTHVASEINLLGISRPLAPAYPRRAMSHSGAVADDHDVASQKTSLYPEDGPNAELSFLGTPMQTAKAKAIAKMGTKRPRAAPADEEEELEEELDEDARSVVKKPATGPKKRPAADPQGLVMKRPAKSEPLEEVQAEAALVQADDDGGKELRDIVKARKFRDLYRAMQLPEDLRLAYDEVQPSKFTCTASGVTI